MRLTINLCDNLIHFKQFFCFLFFKCTFFYNIMNRSKNVVSFVHFIIICISLMFYKMFGNNSDIICLLHRLFATIWRIKNPIQFVKSKKKTKSISVKILVIYFVITCNNKKKYFCYKRDIIYIRGTRKNFFFGQFI